MVGHHFTTVPKVIAENGVCGAATGQLTAV